MVRVGSIIALALLESVQAHAVIKTPDPRRTGPVHKALCGETLTKTLERDRAGPIETALKNAAGAEYNCDPFLCRGYQWEDNESKLHTVVSGDVINFKVDLIAGHQPGYANVSIVDTATNEAIGAPVLTWEAWPGSNKGPDRNDTNFNVTIPDNLSSTCNIGGRCVIQWFWYVIDGPQRYESCVDILVEE
ncbi:hypothetical protein B0I35DRAFT_507819 [Stachybotrys elegans]|uniref:Chitin-binding type-4 domain-containing protein n=1 Tax=Stachybotrys elegans TaxID=80388 RepID=A0A8K0T0N4_9HYPO|nr:hypothetical protein B0I35DRAFT_507819 [Stachybotrys elegans]